jgi:DNA-directed RNA polymerase specialized sigma24 family protein
VTSRSRSTGATRRSAAGAGPPGLVWPQVRRPRAPSHCDAPVELGEHVALPLGWRVAELLRDASQRRRLTLARWRGPALGRDPDDLVQEVCRRILRRNRRPCAWDPSRGSLGHYVHCVAGNAIADMLAVHRRHARAELLGDPERSARARGRAAPTTCPRKDRRGPSSRRARSGSPREAEALGALAALGPVEHSSEAHPAPTASASASASTSTPWKTPCTSTASPSLDTSWRQLGSRSNARNFRSMSRSSAAGAPSPGTARPTRKAASTPARKRALDEALDEALADAACAARAAR